MGDIGKLIAAKHEAPLGGNTLCVRVQTLKYLGLGGSVNPCQHGWIFTKLPGSIAATLSNLRQEQPVIRFQRFGHGLEENRLGLRVDLCDGIVASGIRVELPD